MIRIVSLLFAMCILLGACYNDKSDKLYPAPAVCDTTNVTYSGTISAIMATNCTLSGCHDAATQSGTYRFDTYDGVKKPITNGRLIGAITHASGFTQMPQGRTEPMDACTIAKISAWVNKGAPNN
jgi:hypothetical protein